MVFGNSQPDTRHRSAANQVEPSDKKGGVRRDREPAHHHDRSRGARARPASSGGVDLDLRAAFDGTGREGCS